MNSVCVYCGSSPGGDEMYAQAARSLATSLARRGLRLVYGGGHVGIMGILADAVLEAGGTVTGVIPASLVAREVAHQKLTELHVTKDMHERKLLMMDRSDAFIALPGGLGTLEEIFEVWTWAQLRLHHKPVGILNVAGYFDSLVAFLDHAAQRGFIKDAHRSMLMLETDSDALLDRLEQYAAPEGEKWQRSSGADIS